MSDPDLRERILAYLRDKGVSASTDILHDLNLSPAAYPELRAMADEGLLYRDVTAEAFVARGGRPRVFYRVRTP